MNNNILLTGSTGFLGREILQKIISKFPKSQIYCLIRSKNNQLSKNRLNEFLENKNVHILEGNTTKDNLGLSNNEYIYCVKNIDILINCAASINLSAPMNYLSKQNISSTRNMIKLAINIDNSRGIKPKFMHISTAYQAGNSNTCIEEKFISKPLFGFKNNYEKSKWLTEQLIKENLDNCHFTIFRPSIILSYESGKCYADGAGIPIFGLLDKKSKIIPSALPITKTLKFDFVSVDYVSTSIVNILNIINTVPNGSIFHITDSNGGMTSKEGIEISNSNLGIKLFGINIKFLKFLLNFIKNIMGIKNKKILERYLVYFEGNPTFQTKNLSKYLNKNITTLHSKELYQRAIVYWKNNINN